MAVRRVSTLNVFTFGIPARSWVGVGGGSGWASAIFNASHFKWVTSWTNSFVFVPGALGTTSLLLHKLCELDAIRY